MGLGGFFGGLIDTAVTFGTTALQLDLQRDLAADRAAASQIALQQQQAAQENTRMIFIVGAVLVGVVGVAVIAKTRG